MKKQSVFILLAAIMVSASVTLFAFKSTGPSPVATFKYKQFSTVESIIAGGLGRSRIITTDEAGTMVEKEIENFYSMVGINFGNIANNDRVIVDKINEYTQQGWELYSVTTGVQSPAGGDKSSSQGIYLTRYLFRKPA